MTKYYVHLGFDSNSYRIGSIWHTATSNDYFHLQYALTKNEQAPWEPALFRFQPGDDLYFRFWDLSDPPSSAESVQLTAWVGLNSLRGDIYKPTNNPVFDDRHSGNNVTWSKFPNHETSDSRDCVRVMGGSHNDPIYYNPTKDLVESPWMPARACKDYLGPMRLKNPGSAAFAFKMSFFVGMRYGNDPKKDEWRVFVADPETIIGSGRQ